VPQFRTISTIRQIVSLKWILGGDKFVGGDTLGNIHLFVCVCMRF
jgi:hypothetical protein